MSITKAIDQARSHVRLFRSGKQWIVVSPYHPHNPDGPSTHSNPTDYFQACGHAMRARANLALHFLKAWSYDAAFVAIETDGNLRDRIKAGVREFQRA